MNRNTVFIQANARQMLGAKISAQSYKKASNRPDSFDVRIMDAAKYPRLMQQGQSILRAVHVRQWDPDDLQSFTPLRFKRPGVCTTLAATTTPRRAWMTAIAPLAACASTPVARPQRVCSRSALNDVYSRAPCFSVCGTYVMFMPSFLPFGQPVMQLVGERILPTVWLGGAAIAIAL